MGLNPEKAVAGMVVTLIVIPALGACVLFGLIYVICKLVWS